MNARFLALLFFVSSAQFAPADPALIFRIRREPVTSIAIRSVGYCKRRHVLEIEFVNGAVYRYEQVSPTVHRELIAADSKARYYDNHIKGKYRWLKVRPRAKH